MREWIPVSTSAKGRLVLAAVRQFGARPENEVTVGGLAIAAKVTTGAIYHHFGSKHGLYSFVRADVEQRLLDRMEGAMAAYAPDHAAAVKAGLLVGFDFAAREGFLHILSAPPAGAEPDRVAEALTVRMHPAPAAPLVAPVLGRVLAAAWRSALMAVADGVNSGQARAALAALDFTIPIASDAPMH